MMDKTIAFCNYCKDPIFEGEEFVVEGERIYHKFCYMQKNNYYYYLDDEEGGLNETGEDY